MQCYVDRKGMRIIETGLKVARCCMSTIVLKSLSNNPFENLAFEDWIHEKPNLPYGRILFLWRNEPTVVIGRHQNPWKECDLEFLKKFGIHLARRKSGGGTVYHDLGNVNCTFFTDKDSHNRKLNLEFLAAFLRTTYGLKVAVNKRDDLIFDEKYKISGTAARLSLKRSYHHCTLLCQTDLNMLQQTLMSYSSNITSNATASIRSKTKNLFDAGFFSWDEFCEKLAANFLRTFGLEGEHENFTELHPLKGEDFSAILNLKHQLEDWKWNFGKTPKFRLCIDKEFSFCNLKLIIVINKGLIEDIMFDVSNDKLKDCISSHLKNLVGQRFCRSDVLAAFTYSAYATDDSAFLYEISDWILSYLN